ncbi:MAG: hypothetical protein PHI15_03275 [Methanomicrobium sp.]|nr:hypothetical protein [Methanomicrobium sp.]
MIYLSGSYRLILILGVILLCIPLAAGQAVSQTTIQVYTDEDILGRITSITANNDIGVYSVTITRGMSVSPAQVGDTLKHKDVITLQKGSFADIQLVDRSEKTMLGGGTGGTAILIEKAGGSSAKGATPEVTESESGSRTVYVETEYGDVGSIKFIEGKGKIWIGGGNKLSYQATVSYPLIDGDVLTVTEGYAVVELHDSRVLTVNEGDKLYLYKKEPQKPESFLDPVINHPLVKQAGSFLDDTWESFKKLLRGESFEVKVPSATAGVRG